jgi:hypothetical protein
VQKWKPIERREYTFRAETDAPVEELAQFLAARVHHPVIGHYGSASQFHVPAYHRRARGGTNGVLEIGEEAIRFVSDKPADPAHGCIATSRRSEGRIHSASA